MTGDEAKVCPDCAETVKGEARVCRFCGYRFLADDPPPVSSPMPVRPRRGGWIRSAIVVAGLAIVAVLIFRHFSHRSGIGGIGGQPYATCTVSATQHDVNFVVTGDGADSFCASQAKKLSGSGDFYVVRSGLDLRAPDYGTTSLTVVCSVSSGPLGVKIYDDGGQMYGTDYCGQLEANGWEIRSA